MEGREKLEPGFAHIQRLVDEGDDESFPASDPSSITQPHRKPRDTK